MPRRSLLLHGLRLTLTRPAALLWTYVFNLAIALLFSLRLHAQLASILDHSLAAQRLTSAFDLGTLAGISARISQNAPSTGHTTWLGIPVYLALYFLLVPAALFAYNSPVRLSLGDLLRTGLIFFWRFVRITLLTLVVSGVILALLLLLHTTVAQHIDDTTAGLNAILLTLPTLLLVIFAATVLRLYFDLVAVYTIQLSTHIRPDNQPDCRVRLTLLPALRTLRANFARAWLTFLWLTLLGLAAVFFTARTAAHTLAQPRVGPLFLLTQLGLFLMLFTRFYQRAAQTILAQDNPLPTPVILSEDADRGSRPASLAAVEAPQSKDLHRVSPPPATPHPEPLADPQPNPEPIAPSLPEPDPAVFHHDIPSPPKP